MTTGTQYEVTVLPFARDGDNERLERRIQQLLDDRLTKQNSARIWAVSTIVDGSVQIKGDVSADDVSRLHSLLNEKLIPRWLGRLSVAGARQSWPRARTQIAKMLGAA